MALSGATIPGQSGPRSNGNKGVLRIPQSSSITRASPSDCLVSYPGHSSYASAEKQLVYLQPQSTGQQTELMDLNKEIVSSFLNFSDQAGTDTLSLTCLKLIKCTVVHMFTIEDRYVKKKNRTSK